MIVHNCVAATSYGMKYSFVVSGAAETGLCAADAHLKAQKVGLAKLFI